MSSLEEMAADLQTLGLSPHLSPVSFIRAELECRGVVPISTLMSVSDGAKVTIAGVVTHRQRPATAGGVTFLNLEDETGLVNVVCSAGLWVRYRRPARSAVVMLVRGRLERAAGSHPDAPSNANIVAEYLEEVDCMLAVVPSRDFR
jgi:error-prone DNA polymerase